MQARGGLAAHYYYLLSTNYSLRTTSLLATSLGGLTCNESVALIAASGLAALGLVALAWRRYVLGRRGQGQPLLWHGRAIIDDGGDGDDAHDLSSIREETLVGAGGGKGKARTTLWHGAGGGGAAGGGGPGAEAMRLRLEELRPALYSLWLYLLWLYLLWLYLRPALY